MSEDSVSGIVDTPVNGAPPVPAAAVPVADAKETIVLKLDDSGGLNVAGMREKTKTRLIEALRRSNAELFPTGPAAPVKRFPEVAIKGFYGVIGTLEVAVAARKYPEDLARVFLYTDEDMKVLMDPTQAVIARYAGNIKHEELIALGLALAQVHISKMYWLNRAVEQLAAKIASDRATAAASPAAAPDEPKGDNLQ